MQPNSSAPYDAAGSLYIYKHTAHELKPVFPRSPLVTNRSTKMSLPSGRYIVTSVPGNRFVGRAPIEIQNMSPKPVLTLSEGTKGPIVSRPQPLHEVTDWI